MFQIVSQWTHSRRTLLFMCDVAITPPYARIFVYSELELFFFISKGNVSGSIRFNVKDG